ncbi:hypothetical protein [Micromonospora sp. B9E7]
MCSPLPLGRTHLGYERTPPLAELLATQADEPVPPAVPVQLNWTA